MDAARSAVRRLAVPAWRVRSWAGRVLTIVSAPSVRKSVVAGLGVGLAAIAVALTSHTLAAGLAGLTAGAVAAGLRMVAGPRVAGT